MAEYVCGVTERCTECGSFTELDRRERIVRCRDCKHGDPFCDSSSYPGMIDCSLFAEWDYRDDKPGVCPVESDGFCKWGEERDA